MTECPRYGEGGLPAFDGNRALHYAGANPTGGCPGRPFRRGNDFGEDVVTNRVPSFGLADQGIITPAEINWNLGTPQLVEEALRRGEGLLAKDGPLVVRTGKGLPRCPCGNNANGGVPMRNARNRLVLLVNRPRGAAPPGSQIDGHPGGDYALSERRLRTIVAVPRIFGEP